MVMSQSEWFQGDDRYQNPGIGQPTGHLCVGNVWYQGPGNQQDRLLLVGLLLCFGYVNVVVWKGWQKNIVPTRTVRTLLLDPGVQAVNGTHIGLESTSVLAAKRCCQIIDLP
jgi:hypothetical protein